MSEDGSDAEREPLPSIGSQGGERAMLVEFLDFQRTVLLRKTQGITREQANTAIAPSDLTLASLLKHMAWVEDHWAGHRFAGNDYASPWADAPWDDQPDWEMTSAVDDSLEDLHELYRQSWRAADAIYRAADSLDRVEARSFSNGESVSLRWILIHMIEEYARHLGHADFLRQAVDGATGD